MHFYKWHFFIISIIIAFDASALPDEDLPANNFIPIVRTIQHRIGDNTIPIKIYTYGNARDLVMINLHSNELTSVKAAMNILRRYGGMLIKVENRDERNIIFRIDKDSFQFDPNHMFSRRGIEKDFELYKNSSEKAIAETDKFAKRILSLVPAYPSCIIALHNNFDGGFGINDYFPGNERAGDAAAIYKNNKRDPDDIFFTTDAGLYRQLSADGYNTILQNLETAEKNGSLSMYYHPKKVRYLNCETEHFKQGLYEEMLARALKYIERCNAAEYLYEYKCSDTAVLNIPGKSIPVYRDSLYIGELKSKYSTKNNTSVYGRISFKRREQMHKKITMELFKGDEGDCYFLMKNKTGPLVKPDKGPIEITIAKPLQVPLRDMHVVDSTFQPLNDSIFLEKNKE